MVLPRQLVFWFQLRTLTLVSVGALLGQGANLLICRQADANLRAATLQIALLSSLERQAVQPAATVSAEERARSAVALADQIQAGILELRNLRTGLNPGQAPVPLLPWEGVADRGARMLLDHSQEAETDLERWRTAVLTQARPAVAAEQRLALHRLNDRQVAQLPALLQEREASGRLGLSVMLTVLALAWLLGLLFALRAGRRLRSPMQQLDQIMTECTDLTATAPVVVERRPAPTALFSLSRGFQDLLLKLQAVIERLIKQARTDSLTDVGNRRCFDETFDREWRRGMRSQAELSLLLIDVDHFKQYNDRYGHVLGDACLRQVVAAIASQLRRGGDLLCRIGGEEFAVLLPNTAQADAIQLAGRIVSAVDAQAIEHLSSPVAACVTVSIGVSSCVPSAELRPSDLVAEADQALYRRKRHMGRHGVSTVGPERIAA